MTPDSSSSCCPSVSALSSLSPRCLTPSQHELGLRLLNDIRSITTLNPLLFTALRSCLLPPSPAPHRAALSPSPSSPPPTAPKRCVSKDSRDGRLLELYTGLILHSLGFTLTDCGGGRGDGGIDLRAAAADGRQEEMVVQCKQYAKTVVGYDVALQLLGSMCVAEVRLGLLVTTVKVTRGVRELQRRMQRTRADGRSDMQMQVWDADTLLAILGTHGDRIVSTRERLMAAVMSDAQLLQRLNDSERVDYCVAHAIAHPLRHGECSKGCLPWTVPSASAALPAALFSSPSSSRSFSSSSPLLLSSQQSSPRVPAGRWSPSARRLFKLEEVEEREEKEEQKQDTTTADCSPVAASPPALPPRPSPQVLQALLSLHWSQPALDTYATGGQQLREEKQSEQEDEKQATAEKLRRWTEEEDSGGLLQSETRPDPTADPDSDDELEQPAHSHGDCASQYESAREDEEEREDGQPPQRSDISALVQQTSQLCLSSDGAVSVQETGESAAAETATATAAEEIQLESIDDDDDELQSDAIPQLQTGATAGDRQQIGRPCSSSPPVLPSVGSQPPLPLQSCAAASRTPVKRRARQGWSEEEELEVRLGVLKHGEGRWADILADAASLHIQRNGRSNVNIKDKWRTMQQRQQQQQLRPPSQPHSQPPLPVIHC